jgi:hypothetical protein
MKSNDCIKGDELKYLNSEINIVSPILFCRSVLNYIFLLKSGILNLPVFVKNYLSQMLLFISKIFLIFIMLSVIFKYVLTEIIVLKNVFSETIYLAHSSIIVDIKKIREEKKLKLLLFGFISNPAIFYKLSQISEDKNDFKSAVEFMELAIGLLDVNNGDSILKQDYVFRLKKLIKLSEEKNKSTLQN